MLARAGQRRTSGIRLRAAPRRRAGSPRPMRRTPTTPTTPKRTRRPPTARRGPSPRRRLRSRPPSRPANSRFSTGLARRARRADAAAGRDRPIRAATGRPPPTAGLRSPTSPTAPAPTVLDLVAAALDARPEPRATRTPADPADPARGGDRPLGAPRADAPRRGRGDPADRRTRRAAPPPSTITVRTRRPRTTARPRRRTRRRHDRVSSTPRRRRRPTVRTRRPRRRLRRAAPRPSLRLPAAPAATAPSCRRRGPRRPRRSPRPRRPSSSCRCSPRCGRRRPARYTLRLELKPPEMGRVEMRVEMRDGVLHASIHAEHEGAAQLVRDSLSDLRDRLNAEGVRTGDLTVSDGGVGPGSHDGEDALGARARPSSRPSERVVRRSRRSPTPLPTPFSSETHVVARRARVTNTRSTR